MDTKEAVEVLTYYDAHYYDTAHTDELAEIIDMLYEGGKYKLMWEELYQEYGICPIRKNDEEGYMSNILYKILEELEQKYFPKEAKTKNET